MAVVINVFFKVLKKKKKRNKRPLPSVTTTRLQAHFSIINTKPSSIQIIYYADSYPPPN